MRIQCQRLQTLTVELALHPRMAVLQQAQGMPVVRRRPRRAMCGGFCSLAASSQMVRPPMTTPVMVTARTLSPSHPTRCWVRAEVCPEWEQGPKEAATRSSSETHSTPQSHPGHYGRAFSATEVAAAVLIGVTASGSQRKVPVSATGSEVWKRGAVCGSPHPVRWTMRAGVGAAGRLLRLVDDAGGDLCCVSQHKQDERVGVVLMLVLGLTVR